MKKILLLLVLVLNINAIQAQRKGFKVIKRPSFDTEALITVEKGAFNEKDKDLLMDYLFEYGIEVASDRFKTDDFTYVQGNIDRTGKVLGVGVVGSETNINGRVGKIGGEKFKSQYLLTTKQARESVGHNALNFGLTAAIGVPIRLHSKKTKNIDVQIIDTATGRLVCKISYYGKAIDKAYFYQRVAEVLTSDEGVNTSVQNISVGKEEVDLLSDKGSRRQQERKRKRVSTKNN